MKKLLLILLVFCLLSGCVKHSMTNEITTTGANNYTLETTTTTTIWTTKETTIFTTMHIPPSTEMPPKIANGKVIAGSIEGVWEKEAQKAIDGFKENRGMFEAIDKMFDKYEDMINFGFTFNTDLDNRKIEYIDCYQEKNFSREKAEDVVEDDDLKILQTFCDEFLDMDLLDDCSIVRTRSEGYTSSDHLNIIYNFTEFWLSQIYIDTEDMYLNQSIIRLEGSEDFEKYVSITKNWFYTYDSEKMGDIIYAVDFGANWYYVVYCSFDG